MIDKIREALEYGHGTHTVQDLMTEVEQGHARAWVEQDNVIIARIEEYPQKRILCFWLAAGELEPLLEMAKEVYEWGREEGCDMARMIGRRGWKKPLQEHGWGVSLVEYTKEL